MSMFNFTHRLLRCNVLYHRLELQKEYTAFLKKKNTLDACMRIFNRNYFKQFVLTQTCKSKMKIF